MILLDANILLRLKDKSSLFNSVVEARLIDLTSQNEDLIIAPQSLYEFYVVSTRPKSANGLGVSRVDALNEIQDLKSTFKLLPEMPIVYDYWEKLIENFEINGKTAHDARLVAFMQSHQIKKLYTLNIADFQRFTNVIELV